MELICLKQKILFSLLILVLLMCCIGCSNDVDHKLCSYCGGVIYWHYVDHGGLFTPYYREYEYYNDNGKYYYMWCYKFMQDMEK